MTQITTRKACVVQFALCFGALCVAYYFEYVEGLSPCILCLLERYLIFLLGGLFLIALIFCKKAVQQKIQFSALIVSGLGILITLRHVWLQSFSIHQSASCVAGLESLLDQNIWLQGLRVLLSETNHCNVIELTLFSLSLAQWTSLLFFGLFGLSVYSLKIQKQQ